ncbi:MAG TPA: hypothetical protein VGW38_18255 [Chloroflexota bacterium]|nr:hypothetical protein [Chloroflexota bacterium]
MSLEEALAARHVVRRLIEGKASDGGSEETLWNQYRTLTDQVESLLANLEARIGPPAGPRLGVR